MGEFDLIKTYFAPLAGPEGLGLLDDAALYTPASGYDLLLTKDTMVEGVHFPHEADAGLIAQRLMRVNLSDLAAKGAAPQGYLLSIAWPKNLKQEVLAEKAQAFAKGLKADQETFSFVLYGGDTVSIDGPMVVSATFIGQVPAGTMVRRYGAQPGDDVWVTGSIGDSYLGLKCIQDREFPKAKFVSQREYWLKRFWTPEPRLTFSESLRKYATAGVDISDGIFADLGHIAKASGVKVDTEFVEIPFSGASRAWLTNQTQDARMALATFGDDYELAFTANSADSSRIIASAQALGLPVTRIGKVCAGKGVTCLGQAGLPVPIERAGFTHF